MISFDTNILVYATASISDVNVMRARDLVARGWQGGNHTTISSIKVRTIRLRVDDPTA